MRRRNLSVGVRRAIATAVAVLVGGAAAPAAAMAQEEVRLVRSGIPHDMLFDLAFEGTLGVAVGSFGSILVSDDGGGEWKPASVPTSGLALLGTAVSAGRCLAVGQGGTVLVADDCRTWRAVEAGTGERLMAVALNRFGLAYAVGAFGTVLRSDDGGRTWSAAALDWSALSPTGAEPHLYDVHVGDDASVTLVGEFGLVLQTANGADWRVAHSGEQSLFGLTIVGDKAFAVGQGGLVLASSDRGASWREVPTGASAILTSVWTDGHGRVVVSGLNTVLQATHGGSDWRRVDTGAFTHSAHAAIAASEERDGTRRLFTVGTAAAVLELAR